MCVGIINELVLRAVVRLVISYILHESFNLKSKYKSYTILVRSNFLPVRIPLVHGSRAKLKKKTNYTIT